MKTLTVREPFASLILSGHKRVECRGFNPSFRGRLMIHSAARPWSGEPYRGWLDGFLIGQKVKRPAPVFSSLLGTVELVDVIPGSRRAELLADVRPWAFDFYDWYWVLADPKPLQRPVPFRKGQLGLYDVAVPLAGV